MWRAVILIQICASFNHRKKMKAEPSGLTPPKLTGNLIAFKLCIHQITFYFFFQTTLLEISSQNAERLQTAFRSQL